MRRAKIIQKETRHVARIDRLDHHVNAFGAKCLRRIDHRLAIGVLCCLVIAVGNACHQMQPLDAGGFGVRQRRIDTFLEVIEPRGQCRKTLLAGIPIARRQVEQRLGQIVLR